MCQRICIKLHLLFILFLTFIISICANESSDSFENASPEDNSFNFPQPTDCDNLTESDSINQNVTTSTSTTTTTAPAPPLVERIEVRLIDSENSTQETPLIIVDVVKKNGSGSGIASTIQQQHDTPMDKPTHGFLVRLKQPNYHSFTHIPFEWPTTTTTTQIVPSTPIAEESSTSTIAGQYAEQLPTEMFEGEISTSSATTMTMTTTTTEGEEAVMNDNDSAAGVGEMIQIVPVKEIEMEKVKKLNESEKAQKTDEEEMNEEVPQKQNQDEVEDDDEDDIHEDEGRTKDDEDEEENVEAENLHETANGDDHSAFDDEEGEIVNGNWMDKEDESEGNNHHQNLTDFHGINEEGPGDGEMPNGGTEGEECLANRQKLPKEVVKRLVAERRRIVQAIKKINKHLMQLCQPDKQQNQVPYRKCPMWRREKFFLYYALMRITYCGDHAQWPGGRRFRAM